MLFNSFDFLVFFAVVFAVQAALPHRPRNVWLLAASYLFYAWWDWRFLSLLVVSTLIEFWCGAAIAATEDTRRRKAFLSIAIAADLGMLGFFKYYGFFADSLVCALAGLGVQMDPWRWNIVLPVGISFYTFQTMSYTIDIYRRQMEPARNLLDFALFVTFFPQLVAGPIERAKDLLPQMERKAPFSFHAFQEGGWLVFWGLFKKMVIADNMAIIANEAFSGKPLSGGDTWIGVIAFAIQIYGDFSGYSDIARGTARMMGYNLMLNFRAPYLATNPREFWSRWHVSLSSWLRDYLYIPLGGNRGGQWKTCRNLAITMLLGGLWHGAAWTFVLWGAFQGGLLIAHRFLASSSLKIDPKTRLGRDLWWAARVLVFFQITCVGWMIFRAQSLGQFAQMAHAVATDFSFTQTGVGWLWTIALLCWPLALVQTLQEASGDIDVVLKLSTFSRAALHATLAVMLFAFADTGGQQFIYFQF